MTRGHHLTTLPQTAAHIGPLALDVKRLQWTGTEPMRRVQLIVVAIFQRAGHQSAPEPALALGEGGDRQPETGLVYGFGQGEFGELAGA